jgi:TonB family protein
MTPQSDQQGYFIVALCAVLGLAIIILPVSLAERITAEWSAATGSPSRSEPAPAIDQSASAGACSPAAQWITADDYPFEAIVQEHEGTTTISWIVGDNGRVESCRVTQSSEHDSLDQAGCRALMARGCWDSDALPEKRENTRRIVWRLPK